MSYAEQKMEDIISWEEINGPAETGCALMFFTPLTIGITICLFALDAKTAAVATGVSCVIPSTILSTWIIYINLQQDQHIDRLIQNAKNCAVCDLPKPASYKRRYKETRSIKYYQELRSDLYKMKD